MSAHATANERITPPSGRRQRVAWGAERGIALALALFLLRSAFAHLGNPYQFLSTIYSYQLTNIEVGRWLGVFLPFLQLTIAVCLLCGWWVRSAYLLAAATFVVFVAAQGIALYRGLDISCGCFGAADSLKVGWRTLAVAGAAATAAVVGWFFEGRRETRLGNPAAEGGNT